MFRANGHVVKFSLNNILFGQLLALMIAGAGTLTQYLTKHSISYPAFQSSGMYIALAIIHFIWWCIKGDFNSISRTRVDIWVYGLVAIVDVQAGVLCIMAFRYATLPLVTLGLHFSIPFVTVLSRIILEKKYLVKHYVGSAIALFGSMLIFIPQFGIINAKIEEHPDEMKGLLMSIVAAFFYSISNVVTEFCVSQGGRFPSREYLSFVTGFATLLCALQFATLEYDDFFRHKEGNFVGIHALVAHSLLLGLFFYLVTVYLRVADALMFNLSLLTVDIYSAIASYALSEEGVNYAYWISFGINVFGIWVYSISTPTEKEIYTDEDYADDVNYRRSMVSSFEVELPSQEYFEEPSFIPFDQLKTPSPLRKDTDSSPEL